MTTITVMPKLKAEWFKKQIDLHGSPLLILDCQILRKQYEKLKQALPNTSIYYAIKSLPNQEVVYQLHKLGSGFDIASSGELDMLRTIQAEPRHTIHTHPIKKDKDIRDALRFGCTTFVIDNPHELDKFEKFRHRVGLLLRIAFDNPLVKVNLSKKFGCNPNEVSDIIKKAKKLGLHVKGFSFHVGSQCTSSDIHVKAINTCKNIIEKTVSIQDTPFSILDIGGGFPVNYSDNESSIEEFYQPIQTALKQLPKYIQVIAEPGRFISAPAVTSITTIIGKAKRNGYFWYYLDDGVYNSFSGQVYDHVAYPLTIFSNKKKKYSSVIAGPTCDSIDIIAEEIMMPEMEISDIVLGHMMGAYTIASASEFNSYQRTKIVTINK